MLPFIKRRDDFCLSVFLSFFLVVFLSFFLFFFLSTCQKLWQKVRKDVAFYQTARAGDDVMTSRASLYTFKVNLIIYFLNKYTTEWPSRGYGRE